MLKQTLRAALVLAVIASPALADVSGIVAKTKAMGPANPSCEQFQIVGLAPWYGFGKSQPGHDHALSAILISATPGISAPITFTPGGTGSDPECLNGVIGATGLGLGD